MSEEETSAGEEIKNRSKALVKNDEESRLQEIARTAVAEQFHTLERMRELFRRYSQKRRRTFYEPFVLTSQALEIFDKTVRSAIAKLGDTVPVSFTGLIRLKDRREVTFYECLQMGNWEGPEKSHPVRAQMNWQFTYHPHDFSIPVPVQYDVYVDYECVIRGRTKLDSYLMRV